MSRCPNCQSGDITNYANCKECNGCGYTFDTIDLVTPELARQAALPLPVSNTGENSELVKRLLDICENDDHERGCEGRNYNCSCGFDERTFATAKEAATALATADARIGELAAQGWELSGSITDLGQRLETAETLLEEARRALAPFLRLADNVFSDGKNATVADEVTLWCFNDTDITFGDLRRARATHDRIGK